MAEKRWIELTPFPFSSGGTGSSYISPSSESRQKAADFRRQNPGEMFRPRGPGDTVHQKDESDDSNNYARGGPVMNNKFYSKRRRY